MKEASQKLLDKAKRAIRASRTLLDAGDAEFAAGRAYYAMLYVAEALLFERGRQFGKHSAIHAAYGKEFAKTGVLDPRFHRWLLAAFNLRLQTDYSFDADVSEDIVRETLDHAREFLAAAAGLLSAAPEQPPTAEPAQEDGCPSSQDQEPPTSGH